MKKPCGTLFLIGVALSIAQFVMIRDFVSILYGEEVVIVLVTASFFLGLSVGYLIALRLSVRLFHYLLIASVFLHLTFPFSYRYLAAWLSYVDAGGYAFMVFLFGYALIFNAIFATVLPRLLSTWDLPAASNAARLRTFYAFELVGFMSGFVLVAWSWDKPLVYLLAPYWLILGVILYLTLQNVRLTTVYIGLTLCAIIFTHQLDFHSTASLYEQKHGIRGVEVLYSVNSAYQKVEVLESETGSRYLYLDGLQNLNSTDLESLNYYIALVPAALMRPHKTLLIGNGTLSSVSKVYPFSGSVTSVELDSAVLEGGRRFFTDPAMLERLDRWQLVVDDAKHFLGKSVERYDLVVVDVPSPLTIQEGYLHSVEFYRLVQEHLTEQGVIAVQLSGPLQQNNRTPARVTAALHEVFSDVLVLTSPKADRSFAYGASTLPFAAEDVRRKVRAYERDLTFILPSQIQHYVSQAVPISMDSMDLVLSRGWERFTDRYFDE